MIMNQQEADAIDQKHHSSDETTLQHRRKFRGQTEKDERKINNPFSESNTPSDQPESHGVTTNTDLREKIVTSGLTHTSSPSSTPIVNTATTAAAAESGLCVSAYKNQVDTLIEAGKRLLSQEPVACLLAPESQPAAAMALPPVAESADGAMASIANIGKDMSGIGGMMGISGGGGYTMGNINAMGLADIGIGMTLPRFSNSSNEQLVYWTPHSQHSANQDGQNESDMTTVGMQPQVVHQLEPGFDASVTNSTGMGNNTNNTIGHSKKRARATTDHTPRPSNSFMIYRREKQAEILAQYRGQKALHNNAISKVVADMWREESPEVRAEYAAKAEAEKLQHMIKYPGYKYTPRRGMNSGNGGNGAGSTSSATAARRKSGSNNASKSEHVQVHLLPMPSTSSQDQVLHHATQIGGHQLLSYSPIMATSTQNAGFPLERHFVAYTTQSQPHQQVGLGSSWPYQMVATAPRFIQVPATDSAPARIIQVQGDTTTIAFDSQHQEMRSEFYVPAYVPQFLSQQPQSQSLPPNSSSQNSQQTQQTAQYRPWGTGFGDQN